MDFSLLYKRLIQLVTQPAGFWSRVKQDERTVTDIRKSVLLPLISLISISSFTGTFLFTYNSLPILYPLLTAIEYFLIFFLTIEIVTIILGEISGYLIKVRLNDRIYKLIIYSLTPFMLLMVVTRLFSSLLFINVLGFYGLYILWKGIDILIGGEYKFRIRLFFLYATSVIIFYLGLRWIIHSLIYGFYLLIFG